MKLEKQPQREYLFKLSMEDFDGKLSQLLSKLQDLTLFHSFDTSKYYDYTLESDLGDSYISASFAIYGLRMETDEELKKRQEEYDKAEIKRKQLKEAAEKRKQENIRLQMEKKALEDNMIEQRERELYLQLKKKYAD